MSGTTKKVADVAFKARREFSNIRHAFDEVNSQLQTKFSQEQIAYGSSKDSLLQKLMQKSPSSGFIPALHPVQTPNQVIPLNQEHNLPTEPFLTNPILTHQFVGSSSSTLIFPSFPFGFASKPVFENVFRYHELEDVELEDSRTLWADSVKKKRKRKMNKHKYQKLRKRMRRQT